MRILRIEPRMARDLAELHLKIFPGFFLSQIGVDFLSMFYEAIGKSRGGFGFAAEDDSGIVGSIVCVESAGGFWRRFFLSDSRRAFLILSRMISGDPQIRKNILARRPRKHHDVEIHDIPPALLKLSPVVLSVGISATARGNGVGESLMGAAEAELKRCGAPAVSAFTDSDNDAGKRFFEKCGFIDAAHIDEQSGERAQIQYLRLLTGYKSPAPRRAMFAKCLRRICDIAAGLALFVPFLFVFPWAAALIKSDSDGPIFFRQERLGRGGKPFRILKFRTMKYGGDYDDVTRAGQRLRRLSFDELPQFWNLIRGDMTLVGPRPDVPETVAANPGMANNVMWLKPGLTGLTQVSGRRELSMEHRIALDALYVRQRTLALDLKIVLLTLRAVLSKRGAW